MQHRRGQRRRDGFSQPTAGRGDGAGAHDLLNAGSVQGITPIAKL